VPRYSYKCSVCEAITEIFHLMSETATDCEVCNSAGSLKRVPATFSVSEPNSVNKGATAKQRVDSFISEAKQELQQHKKESRQDYEP